MPENAPDAIRHALAVARKHGFTEVALETPETSFEAKLEPVAAMRWTAAVGSDDGELGPSLGEITSPLVGYYQPGKTLLAEGAPISKGDIVAVVAALGLANDVESTVSGEVVEVLVKDGEPVQYGQVLARVRET